MGQKRRGRPRIDGDIEAEIKKLALLGWTAPQIDREGKRREEFKGRWPWTVRTVRRIVDRYVPRGAPSVWWSLADADPDDAALVLPVLADVIEGSYGPGVRLNIELADWIVRIRRAAPDIPPSWAMDVALNYWSQVRLGESTQGLDEMLAFSPWRSRQHYYRYLNEMGRLHPEWFNAFEKQDSGHPIMDVPLASLSNNPRAFGLVIAVLKHAEGKGDSGDEARQQ